MLSAELQSEHFLRLPPLVDFLSDLLSVVPMSHQGINTKQKATESPDFRRLDVWTLLLVCFVCLLGDEVVKLKQSTGALLSV